MVFYFKKFVSPFLLPLPLSSALLIAGLLLLWGSSRQRLGKMLVTAGCLGLLLFSNSWVADALLRPLEQRFPRHVAQADSPQRIVVLSGGFVDDAAVRGFNQLSESSVARVLEGVFLWREISGSELILSGGAPSEERPIALAMRDLALELGVQPDRIRTETSSRDTEQQAEFLAPTLGDAPFLLVTEASHLPRAVGLFERAGTRPIAAPTHFRVLARSGRSPTRFLPSLSALRRSERALYERMGILWARLRGRL